MNLKVEKLKSEYEKNKEKITELMGKNHELEKRIRSLENTDIIGVVRDYGVTPDELAELLKKIRGEKETGDDNEE